MTAIAQVGQLVEAAIREGQRSGQWSGVGESHRRCPSSGSGRSNNWMGQRSQNDWLGRRHGIHFAIHCLAPCLHCCVLLGVAT